MKKNTVFVLVLVSLAVIIAIYWLFFTTPKPQGKILAQVDNWVLTDNDFVQRVNTLIKANNNNPVVPVVSADSFYRAFIPPNLEKIDLSTQEGKKQYLELIVNQEILAKEAKMRKLDKDPDIAQNIHRAKIEILNMALLEQVLKKVSVAPSEIEEFYEKQYKAPLENIYQRKIREMVFDNENKATAALVELLQGSDFASMAKNRSTAESAKNGGDLGYLVYRPDIKFQKFWEVVLPLEKGQISSIFQDPTTRNFYIVKIDDIKRGEPQSLSSLYDKLELMLKQKKSVETVDNIIDKVKSKVTVDINPSLIH
ncbi:MAG: peptidylprolyl isomerase [Candidatus Omnitrophica bacterium]|nr:peptidylprolyl isomerase [Candidatus Omnitrophota bacterium]